MASNHWQCHCHCHGWQRHGIVCAHCHCTDGGGYVINGTDMFNMLSMEATEESEGTEYYAFPHQRRALSLWDEGSSRPLPPPCSLALPTLHAPRITPCTAAGQHGRGAHTESCVSGQRTGDWEGRARRLMPVSLQAGWTIGPSLSSMTSRFRAPTWERASSAWPLFLPHGAAVARFPLNTTSCIAVSQEHYISRRIHTLSPPIPRLQNAVGVSRPRHQT